MLLDQTHIIRALIRTSLRCRILDSGLHIQGVLLDNQGFEHWLKSLNWVMEESCCWRVNKKRCDTLALILEDVWILNLTQILGLVDTWLILDNNAREM